MPIHIQFSFVGIEDLKIERFEDLKIRIFSSVQPQTTIFRFFFTSFNLLIF